MKKLIPGLRTVKTSVSVIICVIIINLINIVLSDYNYTITYFYAGTAAVAATQQSITKSYVLGGERIFGTMIGGAVSLLSATLYFRVFNNHFELFFIFFSVILAIHLCYLLNIYTGVLVSCIVVLSVFSIKEDNYIIYIFFRTFETSLGVTIAFFVNKYLFPYEKK